MSYTVVVDEQEHARHMENRLNAVARHCKIGKVRYKREIGYNWPTTPLPKRNTFFTAPLDGGYLDFRATNLLGTALDA